MDELRCVRPVLRPPADVSREMGLMKLGRLPKKTKAKNRQLQMRYHILVCIQETCQDKEACEKR